MPSCDVCGTDSSLFRAIVEDVELKVCESCSKFGKVLGPVRLTPKKIVERVARNERPEILKAVVKDFARLIQQKRSSMRLSQKDFAQKVNEKESVIHGLENGSFKPSLELANKLGKHLRINLVETEEEDIYQAQKHKEEKMTLGDFIKIKK